MGSCGWCKLGLAVALAALLTALVTWLISTAGTGAAGAGAIVAGLAKLLGITTGFAKAVVAALGAVAFLGITASGVLGWICCHVLDVKECCPPPITQPFVDAYNAILRKPEEERTKDDCNRLRKLLDDLKKSKKVDAATLSQFEAELKAICDH